MGCRASRREACPLQGCRVGYKMQPVDDPERLKTNPRPKWPVPEEVIEWQPSYVQRGEPVVWRSCLSMCFDGTG